jgi:hypothetical protein
MLPIIIISHPSPVWPGARHLCVAETGRLLAVTRDNVLHAAAVRMREEGYSLASVLVIRDAHGERPDFGASIEDALASSP